MYTSDIIRLYIDMAIIDSVPGVEVLVKINGKAVNEYDVPDYDRTLDSEEIPRLHQRVPRPGRLKGYVKVNHGHVAKYIAVESGAEPQVVVTKAPHFKHHGHHIAAAVHFDQEQLCPQHELATDVDVEWTSVTDSVLIRGPYGRLQQRRFQFGDLSKVAAQTRTALEFEDDEARAADLGRIRVLVYHMRESEPRDNSWYQYDVKEAANTIAEEAVKAKSTSHYITATPSHDVSSELEPDFEDHFLHTQGRPFAVFDFYYRSEETLVKLWVVSKMQLEEEKRRDMSRDQLLEELQQRSNEDDRRLDDLEEARARIVKLEKELEHRKSETRIKREAPTKQIKRGAPPKIKPDVVERVKIKRERPEMIFKRERSPDEEERGSMKRMFIKKEKVDNDVMIKREEGEWEGKVVIDLT
ncbi:hypothetical protein GGR57DRAFT_327041 [Xylariaceae sp. FL1272]|nr:hypothetical protein GGR57DRAFT_327041 [Xylariaceae sp. FL1272]